VVEILQALHGRTGRSFRRLIPALGLARSSVLRWAGRLRRGLPAIRTPGPPKAPMENPAALDRAIADLPHRNHRTFGTAALWGTWQAMISRRDFNDRVRVERRRRLRDERGSLHRIAWREAGAVWAMDPADYGGIVWNLVVDLASRFRFELTVAIHLPATRIADHLQRLFDRYGPPLVLKRDNGSNLVAPVVDELLSAYGVIALTSPPHFPRYNGAVEYAQRETKRSAALLEAGGAPRDAALAIAPHLLNARPRPCLGGRTAEAVLHDALPSFRDRFTPECRKEVKLWIDDCTETILGRMKAVGQRAHDAARRQAIEAWMLDRHIIERVQPKNVLPQSA